MIGNSWRVMHSSVLLAKQCFTNNLWVHRAYHAISQGNSFTHRSLISRLEHSNQNQQSIVFQQVRHTKRGMDFQPNTYKRIKKHGRATRMKTTDGKITIIRRMIKGVPPRKLTH